MDPQIESVIADSKALLALAGPAFEAQKKVASLESTQVELMSKVANLESENQATKDLIKTAADKAAAFFEPRGMLKVAAEEFSAQLQANPSLIFSVVQKFADSATLKEAGMPSDHSEAADSLDPIERFIRQ